MKRRHLALALIFAAVLAVITGIVRSPSGPGPCWATFEKVQDGMSRDEVIATVGGPPNTTSKFNEGTSEVWDADDGALLVAFNEYGDAIQVIRFWHKPPTVLEKLRERFGF